MSGEAAAERLSKERFLQLVDALGQQGKDDIEWTEAVAQAASYTPAPGALPSRMPDIATLTRSSCHTPKARP